jgi:hypothetical protein
VTIPPPGTPSPSAYPEASQATTALVLGILGIVTCPILAPFAWQIGTKELEAIDAGRRDPTNRTNANAGRILGIVGTVFIAIGILFFVGFFLLAIFGVGMSELR